MTLTQLPLRHTTRISTMRNTCHKNNKREKKNNVAWWNILKKNHLLLCRVVHKNIHMYFSTLFNNFWILIFLVTKSQIYLLHKRLPNSRIERSQQFILFKCKVFGSRGFPNFYEGWKWRRNVEKCAWHKIDEIQVWTKFEDSMRSRPIADSAYSKLGL